MAGATSEATKSDDAQQGDGQKADDPNKGAQPKTVTMTQEEFDAKIKERLEQQDRQREQEAADQTAAAEAARLLEQQQFEQLAGQLQKQVERLQKQVDDLKGVEKERDDANAEIERLVDEMMTDVPAHVQRAMVKMSSVEKLAYLREEKDALAETGRDDIPRTPKGGNKPASLEARIDAEIAAQRSRPGSRR